MRVVGDKIDGKDIVMHIVELPNGWTGVLCRDGACKFTIQGKKVTEEALLAFSKEVIKEEFGVGDDYKVRLVKD